LAKNRRQIGLPDLMIDLAVLGRFCYVLGYVRPRGGLALFECLTQIDVNNTDAYEMPLRYGIFGRYNT
jgi:hypothetical protein